MLSCNVGADNNIIGDSPTAPDADAGGMPSDAFQQRVHFSRELLKLSRPIRANRLSLKAAESQDYAESHKDQHAALNAADADAMTGFFVANTLYNARAMDTNL